MVPGNDDRETAQPPTAAPAARRAPVVMSSDLVPPSRAAGRSRMERLRTPVGASGAPIEKEDLLAHLAGPKAWREYVASASVQARRPAAAERRGAEEWVAAAQAAARKIGKRQIGRHVHICGYTALRHRRCRR